MTCRNSILTLIKYADDMALVGCLKDEFTLSQYFVQIGRLNAWFKQSFLKLNVGKTKELVCDNRRERKTPKAIVIDEEEVEIVSL